MFCILTQLLIVAIIACGGYTHPCQVLRAVVSSNVGWLLLETLSCRLAAPHFFPLLCAAGMLLLGSSSQLRLPCDVTEQRRQHLGTYICVELVIREISSEVTALAQCPFPATVAPAISESGGLRSPWWEAVVRRTCVTCDTVYKTCQNGIDSLVSILCPC